MQIYQTIGGGLGNILSSFGQSSPSGPPPPVLPAWATHYWTRDSLSALGAGDPVSTWADEIGAVALAQATPTRRPLYQPNAGDGYIQFDGVDDWLDAAVSSAQPNMITLVVDAAVGGGTRAFFDGVTTREHIYFQTDMKIFAGSVISTGAALRTTNHMLGGVFNGASSLFFQGTSRISVNPGANAINTLRVGANNGGGALVSMRIRAVILALGYAPTTGDLDDLQTYCNTKYGALP